MTIFSANNLGKAYKDKVLFEDISFGMEQGERIGLIGKNGAGKTTILKIIAGLTSPDEGEVIFNNQVSWEYLDQLPEFGKGDLILDAVMESKKELSGLLNEHARLCAADNDSEKQRERLNKVIREIDNLDGWNLENDAKKILSLLGVNELFKDIGTLSGGMRKRVALAKSLISDPDLLILDEPTNHLDADSVQWLQDRLMGSSKSLLFVTHDRYFLDAVSTKIIELDRKKLFSYPGNYFKYLELKESFVQSHDSSVEHMRSRLRTELAWLQKGAKARRSKQKSRIDWIERLREETIKVKEKKIKIELGKSFMGSRIIDAINISKSIGGKLLFDDFTFLAKPKDRIGVIGPNGSGKSTLLNVLSERLKADKGSVKIGPSCKIGFFNQETTDLKDNQSCIGALREIAEYIDVGVGRNRYLTARDLLNRFMFPHHQHSAWISTLSGGEKRRLALLRVLMANPNVLFLDEPTNDFDIDTLNALENYLDDFYGTLIIVSHDRSFLDRTIEFIYCFDGLGNIKEYPGNYSSYLDKKENEKKLAASEKPAGKHTKTQKKTNDSKSKKLSYMEQREFERLEIDIPELEKKKSDLENDLNNCDPANYQKMESLSNEIVELEKKIDIETEKWLELSEKTGS